MSHPKNMEPAAILNNKSFDSSLVSGDSGHDSEASSNDSLYSLFTTKETEANLAEKASEIHRLRQDLNNANANLVALKDELHFKDLELESLRSNAIAVNDAALFYASISGDLNLVRSLVERGANVHADNDKL